jgi:hypothetical protein
VAQYSLQVDARLDKIVGETEVDLDGEQVRARETNLGDLVTDIMRAAAGADTALINGVSIRTRLLLKSHCRAEAGWRGKAVDKMRVYVNQQPVEVLPGMTVRHALIAAALLERLAAGQKAYDEWGNEVGLDGALAPEMKIYVK